MNSIVLSDALLARGEFMEITHFLEIVVPYICAVLDSIGILIIIVAALTAVYQLIISGFNWDQAEPKIRFARALAYSLEFKLAAEIIKTVVVHQLDEFLVLAAVVTLRVVLTFVIHWEIKNG